MSFLELLKELDVDLKKLFVYSIDTNKYEYLLTFRAFDKEKYIKKLDNSTVMHVKNGSLFSINALNKLIEKEKTNSDKPNNEYIINWDNYKNKLIILTNGKLSLSNITKIEDFSIFFKD